MHGIKNMEKHQVSPFGMFSLADRVWTDLVEERTREVFQSIYDAVKKRDTDALNKIKESYIRTNTSISMTRNPFDVFWNGNTVFSLLGSEKDEKSIKFLKDYLQKNLNLHIVFIGIGIDIQVKTGACASENFNVLDKYLDSVSLTQLFSCTNLALYPVLDLLVGKCCEFVDQIAPYKNSENPVKKILYAYTQAYLGNSREVDIFLENMTDIIGEKHPENIGYFYAKNGHCEAVNALTKKHRANMGGAFRGYLQNGYLNEAIRYLNINHNEFRQLMLFMMDHNNHTEYGNLHHAAIIFPLIAAAQEDIALDLFFFRNRKETSSFEKKLLCHAGKVGQRLQTYHLDFKTALFSLETTELLHWILELPKLFPRGLFILDIFIQILTELTENKLPPAEAKDLFLKISFVFNKKLLTAELERYLAPWYDADRCHRARAKSLLNACNEVGTVPQLGKLVSQQLGLFSGYVFGNPQSESVHERPLSDTTKDTYFNIVEKYERRLGFL